MNRSTSAIGCIRGDGRVIYCRGLCGPCWRRFRARVRSGAVTEAAAVASGEALPNRKLAAYHALNAWHFKGRQGR